MKGRDVVYTSGEFNDNGFSGQILLSEWRYSKVLDLFSNFENEISCLNPFTNLLILFVVDYLSRSWRDTFLCEMIKMFAYDEGSIAMSITSRCNAMLLYMICICLYKFCQRLELPYKEVRREN